MIPKTTKQQQQQLSRVSSIETRVLTAGSGNKMEISFIKQRMYHKKAFNQVNSV